MKDHLKQIWTGPPVNPKPIIYLSGHPLMCRKEVLKQRPDILDTMQYYCLSYFFLGAGTDLRTEYEQVLPLFKKHKVRAFLDSGAFSYQMDAMRRKRPIDRKAAEGIIDRYIDYIYSIDFVFDFFATFDYERNPETELWATRRMEARGLHPMPVYHLGTSITALRELIDKGYTLIGLGGLIPYKANRARPFFDQVFNLTEKYGVRCHGFGIGGQDILRYPWFSVDSSAWWINAAQGNLNQESRDGRLADKVSVSKKRSSLHYEMDDHWIPRIAHNIKFWTDMMYKLDKRSAPKVKRGLF